MTGSGLQSVSYRFQRRSLDKYVVVVVVYVTAETFIDRLICAEAVADYAREITIDALSGYGPARCDLMSRSRSEFDGAMTSSIDASITPNTDTTTRSARRGTEVASCKTRNHSNVSSLFLPDHGHSKDSTNPSHVIAYSSAQVNKHAALNRNKRRPNTQERRPAPHKHASPRRKQVAKTKAIRSIGVATLMRSDEP